MNTKTSGMDTSRIKKHVQESEIAAYKDVNRQFNYKLDEKATKAKMVRSAKKIPFEVVEHFICKSCVQSWVLELCCFAYCKILE